MDISQTPVYTVDKVVQCLASRKQHQLTKKDSQSRHLSTWIEREDPTVLCYNNFRQAIAVTAANGHSQHIFSNYIIM